MWKSANNREKPGIADLDINDRLNYHIECALDVNIKITTPQIKAGRQVVCLCHTKGFKFPQPEDF